MKSFTSKEGFPDIYFWNCTPGIKVQQIQNNAKKVCVQILKPMQQQQLPS